MDANLTYCGNHLLIGKSLHYTSKTNVLCLLYLKKKKKKKVFGQKEKKKEGEIEKTVMFLLIRILYLMTILNVITSL